MCKKKNNTKKYYRIPFSHASLLLEARKLATIVYCGKKLPQQQHGHSDQNNSGNYTEYNCRNIHLRRAHQLLLGQYRHLVVRFAIHHERKPAVVVIVEHAQMIVLVLDHGLFDRCRREQRAVRSAVFGISVLAFFVHLTLDTIFVIVTARIAGRTRVAVLARVVSIGRVLTFTFATNTFAFARTDFRFARCYAAFV